MHTNEHFVLCCQLPGSAAGLEQSHNKRGFPSPSTSTLNTFAGESSSMGKNRGSSLQGTTSIFSPPGLFYVPHTSTMRSQCRPTGTTLGSLLQTQFSLRTPGSRLMALISTVSSKISGTSSLKHTFYHLRNKSRANGIKATLR